VQESLNNIVKHSSATEAVVSVAVSGKLIQVYIQDNGKGFDFQDIHRTEPTTGNGFGLIGIYERARILGTVPVIETSAEKGTMIRLSIAVRI
jgi:signal transduction histidine kinase